MGGFGSGNWQSGRPTTSACRALDIRRLRHRRVLEPGLAFSWTWLINGESCGSIGIRTGSDQLILDYRHQSRGSDWRDVNIVIRLDSTPCKFGGRRLWFLCPIGRCGRRVGVLYLGSDGVFACRRCYRLAYECQRETASDRATRRADKLRERLGWEPGILNGEGDKPKGMHWATFERLTDEHDRYVNVSMLWLAHRLRLELPGELDAFSPFR